MGLLVGIRVVELGVWVAGPAAAGILADWGADADAGAFDVAGFWARSGIAHLLTAEGADPPFQRGGMGRRRSR